MKQKSVTKYILIGVLVAVVVAAVASVIYRNITPIIYFSINAEKVTEFPYLDDTLLSDDVKSLLNLAKSEFDNPKPGEYYAKGVSEPWCADFVSYLYNETGKPFTNPNTGSWRIPGIYTLQDYLESIDAWHSELTYSPQPGDIVIYNGGLFGGHTNIVVQVDGDYITTIGGNEGNRIRLDHFKWQDKSYGVQGFGHLLY